MTDARQDLRHHARRGRRAGRRRSAPTRSDSCSGRRVRARSTPDAGAAIVAIVPPLRRARRRVRQRAAAEVARRRPRPSGSTPSSCTATRTSTDYARSARALIKAVTLASRRRRRRGRSRCRPRSTPLVDAADPVQARRHRPARGLGRARADWRSARPIMLAGGLHAGERRRRDRARAALGHRRLVGRRSRRRASRAPDRLRGVLRRVRDAASGRTRDDRQPHADAGPGLRPARSGRARILRRVRRPVRARDADGAGRRADGGVPRGAARSGVRRDAARHCSRPTSAGRRRSTRRAARPATSGVRLFLKREDLAHTGAHKINNALGQALLAAADGQAPHHRGDRRRTARRRDGDGLRAARPRVRGLHGRGGHGATGAERLSHARARRHVERVDAGSRTLKDAINEAMRDWVVERRDTPTTCSARCSVRIRIR